MEALPSGPRSQLGSQLPFNALLFMARLHTLSCSPLAASRRARDFGGMQYTLVPYDWHPWPWLRRVPRSAGMAVACPGCRAPPAARKAFRQW